MEETRRSLEEIEAEARESQEALIRKLVVAFEAGVRAMPGPNTVRALIAIEGLLEPDRESMRALDWKDQARCRGLYAAALTEHARFLTLDAEHQIARVRDYSKPITSEEVASASLDPKGFSS